jgi:hypothetical protein
MMTKRLGRVRPADVVIDLSPRLSRRMAISISVFLTFTAACAPPTASPSPTGGEESAQTATSLLAPAPTFMLPPGASSPHTTVPPTTTAPDVGLSELSSYLNAQDGYA